MTTWCLLKCSDYSRRLVSHILFKAKQYAYLCGHILLNELIISKPFATVIDNTCGVSFDLELHSL